MGSDNAVDALRREMSRVGGALYASGGILVLAAVLVTGQRMAAPGWTAVVAGVALATGFGLWLVGERVPIPVELHTATSALGSVVVSLIVVLAGEASAGLFGIFYVYVAAFAFYYFPLSWAVGEIVVAGVAYAVALAVLDFEGAVGAWVVAMGATVTAGALIGSLGHRQRDLAQSERERAAALAAYDAARATLLRIVSHDLRGPLSTISMAAQTLIDDGDRLAPRDVRALLEAQRRQADRLLQLVSDILDGERLANGTLEPSRQEVEVGALVTGVIRSLAEGTSRVTVRGSATVQADPVFLERAVENLLSNALQHTPEDGPVDVTIDTAGDEVRVVVEDRGPGVPDELKATVFEPFVSRDAARPSPGLGLSVTRSLVRAHGGDVAVADRPGGGARFVLWLPRG